MLSEIFQVLKSMWFPNALDNLIPVLDGEFYLLDPGIEYPLITVFPDKYLR